MSTANMQFCNFVMWLEPRPFGSPVVLPTNWKSPDPNPYYLRIRANANGYLVPNTKNGLSGVCQPVRHGSPFFCRVGMATVLFINLSRQDIDPCNILRGRWNFIFFALVCPVLPLLHQISCAVSSALVSVCMPVDHPTRQRFSDRQRNGDRKARALKLGPPAVIQIERQVISGRFCLHLASCREGGGRSLLHRTVECALSRLWRSLRSSFLSRHRDCCSGTSRVLGGYFLSLLLSCLSLEWLRPRKMSL